MANAIPKVVILGHSFVKRLQSDLKVPFDARADSNFHLEGTATVHLFGVGGRTIEKLHRYDLHVVTHLAPDVVILEVGTNDLSNVRPEVVGSSIEEVVGSSIEELVGSLLDNFLVTMVGVCHVIPRGISFTDWEDVLQRAAILNNYVRVVLEPFPNAFCWTHKDFSSPHKDLYLADGIHVNPLGQYFLYQSYRGAILQALGRLRS